MVRSTYSTEAELRQSFEAELASVTTGGGIHSETGLDLETQNALWQIARSYPEVPDDQVSAARAAFAGQLDGSHVAARQSLRQQQIDEHQRRIRERRNGGE